MASIITLMLARIAAALVALLSLGQASPPLADIILYGGRIVTVDQRFTIAEAAAISNGRFTAVGGTESIRRLASRSSRMIDLAGRTVLPGFIDNHLHSAGGGPGVDLSRARSIDDVLRAVFARIEQTAPGDVVVSNSDWHEAQLKEQRLPLRDDLDPVSKSHPVVLVRGGHEYVVNSAALVRWKIDERTEQPAGGRISRYTDGRLNGELVDAAKSLIQLPPPPVRSTTQRMADRLADYAKLHAVGLTTIRHPGVSIDEYRALQEMQRRGLLSMRVHALLRPDGDRAAVPRALDDSGIRVDEGDEWLRVGGVKLAVDGGFEGGLMREPYEAPFDQGGAFKGAGEGCARSLVCPFHGWVYRLDGALRHVPDQYGFPELDFASTGLVPVATTEGHGVVFVDQSASDIDAGALAGLPEVLGSELQLLGTNEDVIDVNWKVFLEGFLEGYHIKATHRETFFPFGYDNVNVVEHCGRHSRVTFPFRRIEALRDVPPTERRLDGTVTTVQHIFPNVIVARLSHHTSMVVLEPITVNQTALVTYRLANRQAEEGAAQAARDSDFVRVGLKEDREMALAVQRGLASGANDVVQFGRFEGAIVHFHRQLTELLGEGCL